jgi:cell division protein DivIC
VVFIVIAILIVTTAINIISLKMEQAKARDELQALNEIKARLQEEISHIDNEEYIEQQARQQLKMIFPGETLYILSRPTEETEE